MLLNNNEMAEAYEELKETEKLLAPTHRYNDIARVGEKPIDEEYHSDEDTQKLKAPLEVDEIEGLPIDGDEKRHLIITRAYNQGKDYFYEQLYDMSGDKPKFIAGGSIKLKDDLVIINRHLYQISDKNNDLSYVTSHVHELLGQGFFTKYPGGFWNDEERHKHRDENTVCHCDNGEYKRLAIISPHLGDTVEVTPKGNLKFVDTWYNNNDATVDIYEINYDKKNSLIKAVFEDHYEETRDFSNYEEVAHEDNASKTPQELEFERNRKILEEKRDRVVFRYKENDFDLPFYFKENEQSGKVEIFEKADKKGETPLLEVDRVEQIFDWSRQRYINKLVYKQGDTTYQAEISKEGKIVPKLKVSNKELFFSKGNVWAKVKLKPNEKIAWEGGCLQIETIQRDKNHGFDRCLKRVNSVYDVRGFDDLVMSRLDNSAQKEKVQKVKETYYNNKERLKACREKLQGKSEDMPVKEVDEMPIRKMVARGFEYGD